MMPLAAQRHLLSDLLQLSLKCPDLYPMVVAAANEAEAAAEQKRDAG